MKLNLVVLSSTQAISPFTVYGDTVIVQVVGTVVSGSSHLRCRKTRADPTPGPSDDPKFGNVTVGVAEAEAAVAIPVDATTPTAMAIAAKRE
ncbi:hypothetical protein GS4_26_00430 [Gordonia soli NBRC 108243]|uniref:Uncharacterized protein n=1 Tax=Gordonia soli NBRC 108243 TaxID=1223545 RepID=M0QLQ2_9ACTN|nr:hypothetical protein GS4_26_00430 [Gordonia soli NBRC 108243]